LAPEASPVREDASFCAHSFAPPMAPEDFDWDLLSDFVAIVILLSQADEGQDRENNHDQAD
jgi:hypothetical protein